MSALQARTTERPFSLYMSVEMLLDEMGEEKEIPDDLTDCLVGQFMTHAAAEATADDLHDIAARGNGSQVRTWIIEGF